MKKAIILVIIVLVLIGIYFILAQDEILPEKDSDKTNGVDNSKLILSDYGFSFSVPEGWYIWEGQSAVTELIYKTDFVTVLESNNLTNLTNEQIQEYQDFMDNWNIEKSANIVFTNNSEVDYKDRDFNNAGKIMSLAVDSIYLLKQGLIEMGVTNVEIDLEKEIINDDRFENKNIIINGEEARFTLFKFKKYKLIDMIMIKLPIKSNKYLDGKKVQSLIFIKRIRKNDPNAFNELVSFISELNITSTP